MCFSATASFTTGVAMLGIGYVSLKKVESSKDLAFASTPLVFSMHQLAEGCLWLSLQHPEYASWYKPALYVYSFVSQPFWPIWVPLIIWLMEINQARKKLLHYFVLAGGVLSLYLLFCTLTYGISADADGGHIRYHRDYPAINVVRAVYFVTVIIPPFLSTLRYTKLLATAMLACLLIAFIFYRQFAISVWCFFAATISFLMILVVVANNKNKKYVQAALPV
jgi:hypothetical protein